MSAWSIGDGTNESGNGDPDEFRSNSRIEGPRFEQALPVESNMRSFANRILYKIDHRMNEKALPVIKNRSSAGGHFACRIEAPLIR